MHKNDRMLWSRVRTQPTALNFVDKLHYALPVQQMSPQHRAESRGPYVVTYHWRLTCSPLCLPPVRSTTTSSLEEEEGEGEDEEDEDKSFVSELFAD